MEISSKCTIKCPRCPRTELVPSILNQEMSLDTFKKSFTKSTLKKIKSITFEGDFGDAIYATSLIEICKYIKKNSDLQIKITTNGSYKKPDWWQELGSVLAETDIVTFSIDGWDQASNEQYRVNSDFDSIMLGAKTLRETSKCGMIWKAIYFKFNEDNFDKILQKARSYNFDVFESIKSTKFDNQYLVDGVDPLKPVNNVSGYSVFDRDSTNISGRNINFLKSTPIQAHPWARCLNHEKSLFINVVGNVYPCPWFDSGYLKNPFVEKNAHKFNINKRTLEEVLSDLGWQELVKSFESNPLEICKLKCVR